MTQNLTPRDQPIFQPIFKDGWDHLPPVMRHHYANRPFSSDQYSCTGTMQIKAHALLRLFAPLSHLLGGIPIANKQDIAVKVSFKSDPDTANLHFVRRFYINPDKAYVFHSTMIPTGDNTVSEAMKFGLCWRSKFLWETGQKGETGEAGEAGQEGKVILAHNGFSLKLFGKFIPLPLTWLIGQIHAEEQATSNTSFKMQVKINHPLLGEIYSYSGEFEMDGGV